MGLSDRWAWLAIGASVVVFAVTFSWLAILRHLAYQSHAFDLGNMDQALWSTAHGWPLRFTDMEIGHAVLTTRLAIHVEPFLLPLAIPYAVLPGPATLFVTQAVVVALGAVPMFLIARDALGSPWPALAFPLAYLLHPSLQNAVLDDFHAVTLSACFLGWMLLYTFRGQKLPFAVFGLLSASTKEEVSLVVALAGLLFAYRAPKFAICVAALGVGWFVLCVGVIIPHFNPVHHSPYLSRYAYLGHGVGSVIAGIIGHPLTVWDVVTSPERQAYLQSLLQPLGWTSVLGLPVLLIGLPAFAINMLSADPTMYSGYYQYSAELVPTACGAAAFGLGYALSIVGPGKWGRRLRAGMSSLVAVAAVVASMRLGFSPLAPGYAIPSNGAHQALETAMVARIPARDVVAASDEIEPHLSERRWVYLLPTVHPRNGPPARWIALDASVPGLPVTPRDLYRTAERAMRNGYGIASSEDGLLLLRKGVTRRVPKTSFYNFIYAVPPAGSRVSVQWGNLHLVRVLIHPKSRHIDSARPAISIETWWRVGGAIPAGTRIFAASSPVYRGPEPRFSRRWQRVDDSPAWDWVPLRAWPRGRLIHAAFVSLLPETLGWGRVNVAIGVDGAGPARGLRGVARERGAASVVKVVGISVGY